VHFWQALQATNVADGSLARFLILQTEEDFPESNDDFGSIDPPQELIDRLLLIHQGGGQLSGNLADVAGVDEVTPMPRRVPINEQARAVFRALDRDLLNDLRAAHGSGFASILARIEENASKLALIRAVSRDPVDPEITGGDAEWGILIAQHCARQTASIRVSENAIESNHKRALQILQESGPGGMPKSEFTRRTQFMDARQRDGVLQTLVDAQMIEVEMVYGARRPMCLLKVFENNEL
jgi:hypothetical protein